MLKAIELTRINRMLFFIIMSSIVLYFGREFFIIITFAGFLAMLMTPFAAWLESYRIPRVLSSIVSVIIIFVVVSGVIFLLSAQIANVVQEIPKIISDIEDLVHKLMQRISVRTDIDVEQQVNELKSGATGALGSAGSIIAGTVMGTVTGLASFLLVLVFTFLFLLQRDKYQKFMIMLFRADKRKDAAETLSTITDVAHQFLRGRVIAIVLIAILFVAGFLIIGLKNGIILGIIAALFAIIPYAGTLIGGILPLIMTLLGGSYDKALEIVIVVLIVNAVDNYFIEPYVGGGSVRISPVFTILIMIVGSVLWGIAGLILFLPFLGILKIIFERIDGLQSYAYLIGDNKENDKKA